MLAFIVGSVADSDEVNCELAGTTQFRGFWPAAAVMALSIAAVCLQRHCCVLCFLSWSLSARLEDLLQGRRWRLVSVVSSVNSSVMLASPVGILRAWSMLLPSAIVS